MSELASLPLFHNIDGKPVLVLGEGEAAEPKRRLVERAGGIVVTNAQEALAKGVRIAFVALDDETACATAAKELRKAGMIVNVVDRPELCEFTTPSLLDRSPLLIAVGTGGASAGLAKHVRLRLEAILPATLGLLARALANARPALRERIADGGDRRRFVDAALRKGGALDPLDATSHERVAEWADNLGLPDKHPKQSSLHHITLTSDDPDDLTLKQARLLGEADTLILNSSDASVPTAILARARADAERIIEADAADAASYTGLTVKLTYRPES